MENTSLSYLLVVFQKIQFHRDENNKTPQIFLPAHGKIIYTNGWVRNI